MIVHIRSVKYYTNEGILWQLLCKLLIILSLSIIVTGCDSLPTGQSVASLVGTSTVPISVTPIPSSTITPIPSATLTPTASATPTPTFSPTPTIFYNGHEKLIFSTDLGLYQSDATGTSTIELFSRDDMLKALELENAFEYYVWPASDGKKIFISICISKKEFSKYNIYCDVYRHFLSQVDLKNIVEIEFPDNAGSLVEWSPSNNQVLVQLFHRKQNSMHSDRTSIYLVDCEKDYGKIKFILEAGSNTHRPSVKWAITDEGLRIFAIQNRQFFMISEEGIRLNNLFCPFCKHLRNLYVSDMSISEDGNRVIILLGGTLVYYVNIQTNEFSRFNFPPQGSFPILWRSTSNSIIINSVGVYGTIFDDDGFKVISLDNESVEYAMDGKTLTNDPDASLRICSLFPDDDHYFSKISTYPEFKEFSHIYVGSLSTGSGFIWQSLDTQVENCPVWISSED